MNFPYDPARHGSHVLGQVRDQTTCPDCNKDFKPIYRVEICPACDFTVHVGCIRLEQSLCDGCLREMDED